MRARAVLFLLSAALFACRSELPPAIRDELTKTSRIDPGAATVVFFTDFQCPFCRRTHAALAPLLAARAGRVRLVLKHVPLPRHPDAEPAARAAICVESLVPSDRKADAEAYAHDLFAAPNLSDETLAELAAQHGVEAAALRTCIAGPGPEARIRADTAAFDAVSGDGVPLLFIGRTRLEGMQPPSVLAAALDDALGR